MTLPTRRKKIIFWNLDFACRRYRLVVFNGVRSYANQSTAGLEVCALVSCAGDAIGDCGGVYSPGSDVVAPTSFDSLIITRRADLKQRAFYEPTTLSNSGGGLPLGNDFIYVVSGPRNSSLVLMSLVRPRRDVATFGIYGRRFDRDGQPVTPAPSSADSMVPSITLAVIVTFVASMMSWWCNELPNVWCAGHRMKIIFFSLRSNFFNSLMLN